MAASEQRHRCLHNQCTGPPSVHGSYLRQHPLPCRQRSRGNAEGGKNTLNGNRARPILALRASAPATWDQTPTPVRVLIRQRNYSQLKKKKKGTTENNETEINNLSGKEFKILVVKMLTELRKIIDVNSACFNNEQEDIKTMQSDMDNSIIEFFFNCIKNE